MDLAKLHCIDESGVPVRERFHADIVEEDEFDAMLNEEYLDEEEQHYITTHIYGTCHCNCFKVLLEEKELRRYEF